MAPAPSSQLPGISEFIQRLEKIAEECGEKSKDSVAELKDEFLRQKVRAYELLEQVREDIRDRQGVLKRRGNCFETIEKGHRIRQQLHELKLCLPKLQELHKRAQGKRGASKKKEELQARYQDMRTLKRHVDDVHELFASLSAGSEVPDFDRDLEGFGPKAQLLGLRGTARASEEDTKRGMTEEEQGVLNDIRQRDKGIDEQIAQLGTAVDRLNPLAQEIGLTAERQRAKVDSLAADTDTANADLKAMNKKLKEVIKYDKQTNCCCQMVLGIALLCCVGFVFQQLT